MSEYLDESNKISKRPIVTRLFKHPDELFDAHSYLKGSCVLHMLRHQIGNRNFKNSFKEYLSFSKYISISKSTLNNSIIEKFCNKI
jgi:aminopeptidase N